MKEVRAWLGVGFGGFVLGTCLALLLAGVLFANRIFNSPFFGSSRVTATRLLQIPLSTRTLVPMPPVGTSAPIQPSHPTADLFNQAEKLLFDHKPQQVLDLLLPKLDQFKETQDLADGYYYLGQAEIQLGHYQLAAGYFTKLQSYQPTGEHLLMVAAAYELGGDLDHALENYLKLAEWNGPDAETYRPFAQARIEDIIKVIGTPTPKLR